MMDVFFGVYAIILLGGGVIGYVKAKSQVSLIMGIISALLVVVGLVVSQSNIVLGVGMIAATSGLLVVTFVVRLIKTKKVMPAVPLIILSLVALMLSAKQLGWF